MTNAREQLGKDIKLLMAPLSRAVRDLDPGDSSEWNDVKARLLDELVGFYDRNVETLFQLVGTSSLEKCTIPVLHPIDMSPLLRRCCLVADVIIFTPAISHWEEHDLLLPYGPGGDFTVLGRIEGPGGTDLKKTWALQDLSFIRRWVVGVSPHVDKLPVLYVPGFATNQLPFDKPYQALLALSGAVGSATVAADPFPNEYLPVARTLLQVDLPYLDDLEFVTLANTLHREGDALTRFREALHEAVRQAASESAGKSSIDEDVARKLNSSLARIDQSLSTIRSHRLRRVGTYSLEAATLVAAAIVDAEFMAILAGATTLAGLVGREYADYLRDKALLRDNPFHLLWKLKRAAARPHG